MIDIFLLLLLGILLWSLFLIALRGLARLLALKATVKDLGEMTFISARRLPGSGLPYLLLILGIYNLFLSKGKFPATGQEIWAALALAVFNLVVLLSFLLLFKASRSGKR